VAPIIVSSDNGVTLAEFTVAVNGAELVAGEPAESVTFTVYAVAATADAGVPVIAPVLALIVSPLGSAGVMLVSIVKV
jgi:hypothetical protein